MFGGSLSGPSCDEDQGPNSLDPGRDLFTSDGFGTEMAICESGHAGIDDLLGLQDPWGFPDETIDLSAWLYDTSDHVQ